MCTGYELKMTACSVLFQLAVMAAEDFPREIWWPITHNGSPWDEPYSGEDYHEYAARMGY